MDPDELLIFKERKNAELAGMPIPRKKEKVDVLDQLRQKIEAHERQARADRARKSAEKVARGRQGAQIPMEKIEAALNGTLHGEQGQEQERPRFEPLAKGPVQLEVPEEAFLAGERRETKRQIQARQKAGSLNCVWHPWRQAYAICDYCHRGFCFEDIVEENSGYYCLEDVDIAAHEALVRSTNKSANMSMLASVVFLVPLLIFIYSYGSQLSGALFYIEGAGLTAFIYQPVYSYIFPMVGLLVVLLGFFLGIFTLLGSKRMIPGILLGAVVSVMFFYSYLQKYDAYDLAIGLTALTAVALFAYAKLIYLPEVGEAVAKPERVIVQWANIGRF